MKGLQGWSKKVGPRLHDSAVWPALAICASSRNLLPIFFPISVNASANGGAFGLENYCLGDEPTHHVHVHEYQI